MPSPQNYRANSDSISVPETRNYNSMNSSPLHIPALFQPRRECAGSHEVRSLTNMEHVSPFCMAFVRDPGRLQPSSAQTPSSAILRCDREAGSHRKPQAIDGLELIEVRLLSRPAAGRLQANALTHRSNAEYGTQTDSCPVSVTKRPARTRPIRHRTGVPSAVMMAGQAARREPRKACHEKRDACQRPPTGGKPHRHP